ncbi:MAG: glutamine--fructose-6-phosphate transaminase (isomerizing) [Candidatus Aenigmarchaeota archaeon]|nr:glutamine--fructose-6-phosphate transaminase (isomerizing) [Candidatus Aenigmarchaeota archaeon]MDI6722361.1 glutamine--fructose-6-phosphate transaminase (isomerizing) [Candidatus Aenigmarchaeota archaeon]
MCGIVGIVNMEEFSNKELLKALKRLEYRGYDSYGYVTGNGLLKKEVGEIEIAEDEQKSTVGLSHCRWATHGGVTQANAHPHTSCDENIFIVHNGIIDNYQELKTDLEEKGHRFKSQTDSEVIAHFFEEELKTKLMEEAVKKFFIEAKGEFAVLLLRKNYDKIYAFKRGSPLVLGLGDGMNILASDIYAFSDKTNKAIFFNEDEFAEVTSDCYRFYKYASELIPVKKEIQHFEWKSQEEGKEQYEHYMLKEIHEEPEAAEQLIKSLKYEQKEKLNELKKMIGASKRVVFVAAGTSYHASLLGVYFLNKAGIEAHTIIASEFRNFTLLDENTLVIAITQSGETMDVIEALRGIKQKGVKIASFVNVPYSTVQRMSNISINICAGQEICVAATKTFVNQIIALAYLATMLGYKNEIEKMPEKIEKLLGMEESIKSIAKTLKSERDIYIIGRGFSYPVAREIALKLKEIAYIHAEGMMGGELKHGTLALIEEGTPVISLIPEGDAHIISNTKEVDARGGRIISISNSNHDGYETIKISSEDDVSFSILAAVTGQLLTYYIAKEKELPIDRPRNLAKSCTVL